MVEKVFEAKPGNDAGVSVEATNAALAQVSDSVYGGRAKLSVVDPGSLVLLKHNAHYFPKSKFDQLVANVQGDGMLSSVPLCHTLEDGRLEVLSGNHRVQAAIKAGLDKILVMVLPYELTGGRKVSRQIAHNALVGEDDRQILADLRRSISSLEDKLYSGLDSNTIAELEKIQFSGLNAITVPTEQIVMWFLPEEREQFEQILEQLGELATMDRIFMAPLSHYDAMFKALVAVKNGRKIVNTAVAMLLFVEKVSELLATQPEAFLPAKEGGDDAAVSDSAVQGG